MHALLLASQLIIPQIPADVTEDHFIHETIKTYSCVAEVEEDGIVHTLDQNSGESVDVVRLIVTAKSARVVKSCAKQLTTEIEGLKLEETFSLVPAFVVSYTVPSKVDAGNQTDSEISIQAAN